MKIAMINAEWLPVPPVLGGAVEATLYETARAIRQPELEVISPWVEELTDAPPEPPGVFRHVRIRDQEAHVRATLGDRLPPGFRDRNAARRFYYLNGVADLLTDQDPDVIQIHNRAQFAPFLVRQFPGKRIVLYMHNEFPYDDPEFASVVQRIDHFVFVSHYLARRFHANYGHAQNRTTVIHNSVDTTRWHPDLSRHPRTEGLRSELGLSPDRTVLFLGRTVPQKGVHLLIGAMAHVVRELPDARLIIAGSPFYRAASRHPYLSRMRKLAAELNGAVTITGYVEPADTPYLYAAADLVVVPSLWGEPFGKVVIEAMAAGRATLASNRGAIPEIIDHNTDGLLVDNPAATRRLADQIVSLLNDRATRHQFGRAAREKVMAQFDTTHRLNRLRAFYRALPNQPSRTGEDPPWPAVNESA
jgi:spore coat protein SA